MVVDTSHTIPGGGRTGASVPALSGGTLRGGSPFSCPRGGRGVRPSPRPPRGLRGFMGPGGAVT